MLAAVRSILLLHVCLRCACSSPGGSLLDTIWSCPTTVESNASPSCQSDRNSTSYGSYQRSFMHEVFADRSAAAVPSHAGYDDLSPNDDAAVARPKLRTDDGDFPAGKDRFASPGHYSPFGTQFGGGGSPSGWSCAEEMRADRTWTTSTSFQDWMASSRRHIGPGAALELNQLGTMFSDLNLQHNWSSSPSTDQCGEDSHDRRASSAWSPSQTDLPLPKMKSSPVAADSGYRGSPPARNVIGQSRGVTGMPVFPVGTPPKLSKESPKEAYERLTTEQMRQQYLSRLLAMQLGHASPGSAATRLPGPFWPPQNPAVFGCEPALGNPALVAGKVPVIIGPTGPVAYDISTVSPFGVPQLVPAFRAFRYLSCNSGSNGIIKLHNSNSDTDMIIIMILYFSASVSATTELAHLWHPAKVRSINVLNNNNNNNNSLIFSLKKK